MSRTKSELKVINFQLEILTEFKCEVDHLLSTINQVICDGRSWTEGIQNNQTYHEINQYLTVETSNCISNCQSIARERLSLCPSTPESDETISCQTSVSILKDDKDYRLIKEKIDHLSKCVTSLQKTVEKNETQNSLSNKQTDKNAEKIKIITTKNKNLEKEIETLNKRLNRSETKSESKIEEIMEEFHRASDFMSDLQRQIESVLHETIENETKIKDLSVKVNESENDIPIHTSSLETLCQDMQSKFCVQNESIQNLDKNIKSANELNKTNLIGINNELEESKNYIFKMKTDWEILKNEVNEIKENVNKYNNFMSDLQVQIEIVSHEKAENETKIKDLSVKVNESENNIPIHTSSLETLCQDMQSKFCVQNELIQNLEKKIKNANEINKTNLIGINNELKESKNCIFKMKTDWEILKNEVNEIEENVNKYRNFMSDLQEQIENVSHETIENETKIKDLSVKVNESENDIPIHSSLLETLRQDMQSKCCVQNEHIHNIEKKFKKANEINKKNFIGISNELKESKDVIFKMKTDWETLKDEVNKMEENVNKFQNMVDPLKKDFLDLTSLVTKLEESTEMLSQKQTEKSTELQNKLIIFETKLKKTSSQAENISQLITQLQPKTNKIGFNIQLSNVQVIDLQQNEILECFNHVIDDYGGNYDVTTGIFTAPVDGLYLFGLFITNRNKTDIRIYLTVKDLSGYEINYSHVFCKSKNSSASVVVPHCLSKSEQVYLRSGGQYPKLHFTNDSFFMGVLISEY